MNADQTAAAELNSALRRMGISCSQSRRSRIPTLPYVPCAQLLQARHLYVVPPDAARRARALIASRGIGGVSAPCRRRHAELPLECTIECRLGIVTDILRD